MQMAGGNWLITGTVTAPSTNSDMVIQFGKTLMHYMFWIEAEDESKEDIVDSSEAADKAYIWYGIYPVSGINNVTPNNYATCLRLNPSTNAISASNTTALTKSATELRIPTRSITSASPNNAYYGLSYKYFIAPINNL